MADLNLAIRFEEADGALQTLRNVYVAALLYLEKTPDAEWPFGEAEAQLIRRTADELNAVTDQIAEMVISLNVVPVPRSRLTADEAAIWERVVPLNGYTVISRSNLYGVTAATFPPDEFGNVTRGGSHCDLGQTLL